MAKESKSLVTPKGTIKFPVTTIGDIEYEFLKSYHLKEGETGKWKFVLTVDPKLEQTQDLLDVLRSEHAQIKGANFEPFGKDFRKDEDGNKVETGLIKINFTSNYPIKLVDSKLNPCDVDLFWGAEVVVKFSVSPVNNKGKVGLGRYATVIQIFNPGNGVNTDGLEASTEGFTAEKKSKVPTDLSETPTEWSE